MANGRIRIGLDSDVKRLGGNIRTRNAEDAFVDIHSQTYLNVIQIGSLRRRTTGILDGNIFVRCRQARQAALSGLRPDGSRTAGGSFLRVAGDRAEMRARDRIHGPGIPDPAVPGELVRPPDEAA